MLDMTIDQLRGSLLLDWVATKDRFRVVALLAGKTASSIEVCLLTRNKAQRPVLLSLKLSWASWKPSPGSLCCPSHS
jgi:hypothetical protein